MIIQEKLLNWSVQVFGRMGKPGEKILQWLGFLKYYNETWEHDHRSTCTDPDVEYHPKAQGHIRQCKTCGAITEIHFAYWEEKGGYFPEDVSKWLLEVIDKEMQVEK